MSCRGLGQRLDGVCGFKVRERIMLGDEVLFPLEGEVDQYFLGMTSRFKIMYRRANPNLQFVKVPDNPALGAA